MVKLKRKMIIGKMLFTSDIQIIKLPEILIEKGIIDGVAQFYEETGITKSFFSQVKNQEKYGRAYHFTPAQIERICLRYGINFNFVFATSDEVFNNNSQQKVNKLINN